MTPREIHDPEVLAMISKECAWMVTYVTGSHAAKCYQRMSVSAQMLRDAILGRNHKYPCPACAREIAVFQDATFRYHYSREGVRQRCPMSGKPAPALTP